jgi:hypothetical protein
MTVALGSSYLAYMARTFKKQYYGAIELIFGLASIFFSVYSVALAPFLANAVALADRDIWQAVFGFLAGVYIIVRGLANIEDALRQGPLTPTTLHGLWRDTWRKLSPWLSLLTLTLYRPKPPQGSA